MRGDRRSPEALVDSDPAVQPFRQPAGESRRVSFDGKVQVQYPRTQQRIPHRSAHEINCDPRFQGQSPDGLKRPSLPSLQASGQGVGV